MTGKGKGSLTSIRHRTWKTYSIDRDNEKQKKDEWKKRNEVNMKESFKKAKILELLLERSTAL